MIHLLKARNFTKRGQQKTPEAMPPGLDDPKWKNI
jgi:hypothetical protein